MYPEQNQGFAVQQSPKKEASILNKTTKLALLTLLLSAATLTTAAYCTPYILPHKPEPPVCSAADLKAYEKSVEKKIMAAWARPAETSCNTEVRFAIKHDGSLYRLRLAMSSGIPAADEAALTAVSNSFPMTPMPPGAPNVEFLRYDFDTTKADRNYRQEIQTLTRTINSNRGVARAYRLRGESHFGLAQYTEALADYGKCLQLAPSDANAHRDRALCYEQLSKHREALDDWNAAYKLEPADHKLKLSIAKALWKLNQRSEAFAATEEALSLDLDVTDVYKLRASFYLEDHIQKRAVQELTRAITASPQNAELYELRADAREYFRETSEKVADLTTAISLRPQDPQLYLKRAKALPTKPNDRRIQQDCSKALELDPTLVEAYTVRASDHDTLGHLKEAARDLTLAINEDPTGAYLFSKRGNVFARMGLYDKAMSDYKQAYKLDPVAAGQGDVTILRGFTTQPTVRYAYINKSGKEVSSQHYHHAGNYSEGLASVLIGGRYGFINLRGATVIKPSFRHVGEFHEGLATAGKVDFEYGFINRQGKFVIQPSTRIESTSRFSEGLVPVEIGGRTGYLDRSGKVAIKPLFDQAGNFSQGLAYASIGNKYGFINKRGTFVIKPAFELAGSFSEGLAPIVVPGQGCRLRKAAEESKPSVMQGCHIAYIDKTGKIVTTIKPSSEGTEMESLVQGRRTCFDATGRAIVEPTYNAERFSFNTFSEELAAVPIGGKFGFVDKSGNFVIPAQFDAVGRFSHGLAAVRKGERSGFIDKAGKFVIKPKYLYCADFSDGLAAVALFPKRH